MRNLNKRKIQWIVREAERREMGAWSIGQQQNITARWVREVHKKYKHNKDSKLKSFGRKPTLITD